MKTLFFPLQLESIKLEEGSLYVSPSDNGKLQVIKILKLDDYGAHIAMYENQYEHFPKYIDETTLTFGKYNTANKILSIGHLPLSYSALATYKLLFVQSGITGEEELEGYKMWQEASGGYF